MIVTFYGKNFKSLTNNSSLNVGNYTLKRRAVELDECTIESEPFTEDINPCFCVLKDDFGRYKYAGFAGVPELTNKNITKCSLSDLKSLLNNDIVFNRSGTYTYVYEYFNALFSALQTQVIQNSFLTSLDTSKIASLEFDNVMYPISGDYEIVNVFEEFQAYLKYYDLTIESELSLSTKRITFKVLQIGEKTYSLNTSEWGINNYGKWIASVNEVQPVVDVLGALSYGNKYLLLSNNVITTDTSLRDIFPIKKTFILNTTEDSTETSSLLLKGSIDAIKKLVEARYNESINIKVNNTPFSDADFSTQFRIYVQKGVLYKTLPVGEITEKQDGSKEIKIGYKNDSIALLLK